MRPFLLSFLWRLLALCCLGMPAWATWSIVAIDRATGEVCVASATCIANFNLKRWVPVLVVGKGGAAAQSVPDANGSNRLLIRDLLLADATPAEILATLDAGDISHQTRQYGIAAFSGVAVTHTGTGAGAAALGVVGRLGSIEYAIQGNVLAGDPVIELAEELFLGIDGDLTQRVMAAMEGARAMGGDGRCSCDNQAPTSCGSPPPGFLKSAHCAFIVSARAGDSDGACDTNVGCADGSYFLKRNVIQSVNEPDPVIELQRRYDQWRENKSGRPDHVLTRVRPSAPLLPADGLTESTIEVELVDINGIPLTAGGQTLTITSVGDPVVDVLPAVDNGDGTHTFRVRSTTTPGLARLRIVVTEGNLQVQLSSDLELAVEPAADLHVGHAQVSASAGADVALTLDRDVSEAGRAYLALASGSGTAPGTPFGGGTLPLNQDRVLLWTLDGPALFPGSSGSLDGSGRASATLRVLPGVWSPLVGSRLDFCAVLGSAPHDFTTVDGFDLVP